MTISSNTAIETKIPPTYANISMADLERKIFESGEFNPFVWLRFLDDLFCLWTEDEEKLNNFFKYLNEFYSTIKFTIEKSHEKINFLVVVVYKQNKDLSTDLYTKDTHTQINTYMQNSVIVVVLKERYHMSKQFE